jgi:hypothetical protein
MGTAFSDVTQSRDINSLLLQIDEIAIKFQINGNSTFCLYFYLYSSFFNILSKHANVIQYFWYRGDKDRLCGLVVRVPVYRSRGSGSIPGTIRFSVK